MANQPILRSHISTKKQRSQAEYETREKSRLRELEKLHASMPKRFLYVAVDAIRKAFKF